MKYMNISRRKVTAKAEAMLCAVFVFLCLSCVDYSDATQEVAAKVQLLMPHEFTTPDLPGHTIVMQQGTQRLTATTDEQGVATFHGIVPDVYDISCSWEITGNEYRHMTGDNQVVSGATVSGSRNSYLIREEQTIQLQTSLSINRDILIGKIFYAGSKDLNNRTYMAGKYVELYNQSDDSVDVSGLYIGFVEGESAQAYTLGNLHDAFADSVILLKQIFRIPANKPHWVEAGGTVLLVNSAIDHTTNNTMESNLTQADFEAKDLSGKTQNNPATPALELVYTMYPSVSNMNMVQSGPCAVVIFRTSDDVAKWQKTYAYGKTSGNQWLLCPKRYIIDGVDVLRNRATGVEPGEKRLYADIDAGYTYINAVSGWNGEVVYRTTSKLSADGHPILTDTNNSSNDFKVSSNIKPREYDR